MYSTEVLLSFETLGELRAAAEAMGRVEPDSYEAITLRARSNFDPDPWAGESRPPDDLPLVSWFRESLTFSLKRVVDAMRAVVNAEDSGDVILTVPYPGISETAHQQMLEQTQKHLAELLRPMLVV